MKVTNVTKSILSVSSPGTHLKVDDHALARKLTRYVNEVGGDLKQRKPDHFGIFASLPLGDVEDSLEEISYAYDTLNADGFILLTNSHGSYLGHKNFDPVFDELNRRKAIVFIHPTTPCLSPGTAATPLPQFPTPMFEFLFDTSRAVINLFLSGTVSRCPNITFIVPHVGGTLPPLVRRFASAAPMMNPSELTAEITPSWVKERLNSQFYFDTAGWPLPEQTKGLLEYVTVDRMLYGTDFPFSPMPAVAELSALHDQWLPELFKHRTDGEKLCSRNALELFKARE